MTVARRAAMLALAAGLAAPIAPAATLAWDAVAHPAVAGYEVHFGLASGDYAYSIDAGPRTSVALPPLAAGRDHYVVVTAYDAYGGRGAQSNELVLPRTFVDAMALSAGFEAFPLVGVAPHAVRFSPSVTGAVLTHRWHFGDGTDHVSDSITPLPDVVHVYERPGTFSATLTVTGPGGLRASHRAALVKVLHAGDIDGCPCILWGSATPRVPDDGSDQPVTVGMRFATARDGFATGIRFYRSAANRGPHVGALWTADGQRLGTVTFADTASAGWLQASFATPIAVRAQTTYVVSYHAPHGHVARDDGAFLKNVGASGFRVARDRRRSLCETRICTPRFSA